MQGSSVVTNVQEPIYPGELEHYSALRAAIGPVAGEAYDRALARKGCTTVDLMWALPFHDSAKAPAYEALSETRGNSKTLGGGVPCPSCHSDQTISQPIQTNSGDEPTKLLVKCQNRSCGDSSIVG